MADCHNEFQKFHEKILLSDTQEDNLRRGRDALREKIKKFYSDKKLNQPTFHGQGSFKMRTTIIQSDADYDLDDGVYLSYLPEKKSDWPKTDKVHSEILEAVKGHTDTPPVDKTACVRVKYKKEYHIDLAIYGEHEGCIYLARKGEDQWEENDPQLFTDWFRANNNRFGEQHRSICKYIKKWSYYNTYDAITGFLITILVGNNFATGFSDRDDIALVETLKRIVTDLQGNLCITRPVTPKKNMTSEYSINEFTQQFIDPFTNFFTTATLALNSADKKTACDHWRELFGSDFPEPEVEKTKSRSFASTVITSETKPWRR